MISKEGQEVLANEDRNYLVRQKPFEQLQEEDPDNVWAYDANGNKMLMRGEPTDVIEDEEDEDPMAGLRKLTEGLKEKPKTEGLALEPNNELNIE